MQSESKKSVWPVMITPFTEAGSIDYPALGALIEWYEQNGVDGLFGVCQSSEMFFLSLKERVELAAFIKKNASVPVIVSGHVSYSREDQLDEVQRMADTGADAVILLSNRFAVEGDDRAVWRGNLEWLLGRLDKQIRLGLYECPYPYKHLLSREELELCASTGQFHFLKDTCCDLSLIRERIKTLSGSSMGLYNANTTTLLGSLRAGARGFSGVMANFHPDLYAWLVSNWEQELQKAELVQSVLTLCSFIEKQLYPVNAKYHLSQIGLPMTVATRSRNPLQLCELYKDEVRQMETLVGRVRAELGL